MTAVAVDVETDLAASIVGMWTLVHAQLEADQPRIGHIEEQAHKMWASHRPWWQKLARAPAYRLAGDTSLGGRYVTQLGNLLNDTAASGLATGMDLLIGRGWDPEVAWHRALLGYGLDARGVRGLIGGTMQAPNAGGASVASSSLARTAVRTLLTRAQKLARMECRAWEKTGVSKSTGVELIKAYDPHERRDADGKWTRNPAGRVAEREADPLAGLTVAEETKPADPFAAAAANPFSALAQSADPFESLRWAGAKQAQEQVAAQAAAASGTADPWAAARAAAHPETRHLVQVEHHVLFFGKPLGATPPPDESPPSPTPRMNYYLPLDDISEYFNGGGTEFTNHAAGINSVVNFGEAADYYRYNDEPKNIALQSAYSPWAVARPIEGINDAAWDRALDYAVPLWQQAVDHPVELAQHLTALDLDEISNRAGFDATASAEAIREQVQRDVFARSKKPATFDASLIHAMADYVVWSKPKALSDMAKQLNYGGLDKDVTELTVALQDIGITKLRKAYIPAVFSFTNGLHGKDAVAPDAVTGQYTVRWTTYRSAIGTFGISADPGKIGIREITTKPHLRV